MSIRHFDSTANNMKADGNGDISGGDHLPAASNHVDKLNNGGAKSMNGNVNAGNNNASSNANDLPNSIDTSESNKTNNDSLVEKSNFMRHINSFFLTEKCPF